MSFSEDFLWRARLLLLPLHFLATRQETPSLKISPHLLLGGPFRKEKGTGFLPSHGEGLLIPEQGLPSSLWSVLQRGYIYYCGDGRASIGDSVFLSFWWLRSLKSAPVSIFFFLHTYPPLASRVSCCCLIEPLRFSPRLLHQSARQTHLKQWAFLAPASASPPKASPPFFSSSSRGRHEDYLFIRH